MATPSYVPTPTPTPLSVSGLGAGNSARFELPVMDWTVDYHLGGSCSYQGTLTSADGSYNNEDLVSNTRLGGPLHGPLGGSLPFHVQFSGTYYVTMNTGTGCPWSVTFTPR